MKHAGGLSNRMADQLNITLNSRPLTVASGTTITQMLAQHPHEGPFPAIGAVVDNRMSGLNRAIRHHAAITTLDMSAREGMEIYRRTTGMLFYAAIAQFDPKARVVIGQSVDEGYVFEPGGFAPTPDNLARLEAIMRELVAADIPLDPEWVPIEEAIQIFERTGRRDRVLLLRQMRRSDVPLLRIGNYTGYVHGPVAPRTGMLDRFKLHRYNGIIVLEFPHSTGQMAGQIPPRPKMFAAYEETRQWHELLGVHNVAQLNEMASRGTIAEVIKVAEALHEKKIAVLADEICARRGVRFVFVAGPSSSGKTTFSKRLAIQLLVNGVRPMTLAMDNYFVDREQSPRHADGSYNLESVDAVDLPLFNEHLQRFLRGDTVDVPVYSFPRGQRSRRTHPMRMEKGHTLIIEGIHGLNPRISASIPADSRFKIGISALTQLCTDDHNRIFTSDTRLLRRIVRDRIFRGYSAADTIQNWPSVRAGEAEWITPFLEDADALFNSALCYEHAVLKNYAERFLTEVPKEHPSYVEALRLFRFLDLLVPLQAEDVPNNSILREFIGRSAFRY